ncbi:MAG: penicillin-binding protein 1C [Bacteroidales bacterium]|nr:penicillin-binding protein 1C [Bacteroidales bacterium]
MPATRFNQPTSSVIEDNQGNLMGARIADDGQWRFPYNEKVPEKFKMAILQFEDKNFYYHPGVDAFALVRAGYQDLKARKIVSGGSTLTMQVVRLSRHGKRRSFTEKFLEILLSLRLELLHSKNQILAMYASHAPFGGNVVGLDAAAWRYYGRNSNQLSWAETATLAVLPNAPSLIFPGKNHQKLLKKRNRLLEKLYRKNIIDSLTMVLSKSEPLPGKPLPLPALASHLLTRIAKEKHGQRIRTTIDRFLQTKTVNSVQKHYNQLKYNHIYNIAAIVTDVETGGVLAYVGNTTCPDNSHGNDVDIIMAPRSTGSILKPILYAAAINDGLILPNTLLPDIPTDIAGYNPQNYNHKYSGVVHASQALSHSLNVPAVRLLRDYGVEQFHDLLQRLDFTTITQPADHYGLSLILGGAEATLWDLTSVYAGFSRALNHFGEYNGKYNLNDYRKNNFYFENLQPQKKLEDFNMLSAAAIYFTFQALTEVNRPTEDANWQFFGGNKKVAWKTGTSFGNRDAWAIGTTTRFTVGIWVGNANGVGRPGLTGVGAAAPVLFDIFDILPESEWFDPPYDEMRKVAVCRKSGMRATDICNPVDTIWIPVSGLKTPPCKYHRLIHLDVTGIYRVTDACEDVDKMQHRSWFVLPPVEEWYYKQTDPTYVKLPPFKPGCSETGTNPMEIIYPQKGNIIYIPKELTGKKGQVVFKIAHRQSGTTIFWHIDQNYMGETYGIHEMGFNTPEGKHILTVVDELGNTASVSFEVKGKKN